MFRGTLKASLILALAALPFAAPAFAHNGEVPPSPPAWVPVPRPDPGSVTPSDPKRPNPHTNPNRPARPSRPSRPDRPNRPNTGRLDPSDPLSSSRTDEWTLWWTRNRERFLELRSRLDARYESARSGNSNRFFGEPGKVHVDRGAQVKARSEIVSALLEAAKHADIDLSTSALVALGKSGDPRALPILLELAKDAGKNRTVREAALLGLGLMGNGDGDIRAFLAKFLDDSDRKTRERAFAALALGFLGNSGSIPQLMARTRERGGRDDIPVLSILSLGLLGDPIVVPDLSLKLAGAAEVREPDDVRRAFTATALGKIGSRAAVPALTKALGDKEKEVRRQTVLALGALITAQDSNEVKSLLRVLSGDRDSLVRGYAAVALGEAGDLKAADALLFAYRKGDVFEVPFAALGLGLLVRSSGDGAAQEKIRAFLRTELAERSNATVQGALALAVGLAHDRKSVPVLQKLVAGNGAVSVRGHSATALGLIGAEEAVPALRAALAERGDHLFQREVATALALIGDSDSLKTLVATLEKSNSQYVRGSAAMALGFSLLPHQAAELVALAADATESDTLRALACLALGRIVEDRPLPALYRLSERVGTVTDLEAMKEAISIF